MELDPQPSVQYIAVIVIAILLLIALVYTDLFQRLKSFFFPLPILPLVPPTYKQDDTQYKRSSSLLPYDNTRNQTWCFIGEDNTGRYCVKVPSPDLCEPIRTFGQRESCELIEGSQMPLGIVTKSGHSVKPISQTSVVNSAKLVSNNDSTLPFFGPEPNPNKPFFGPEPNPNPTVTPIFPLYPFSSQTRTSID
jgi:hypothetical protein